MFFVCGIGCMFGTNIDSLYGSKSFLHRVTFLVSTLICLVLQIHSLDISAGGALGVSASSDGHLRIWETATGIVRVSISKLFTQNNLKTVLCSCQCTPTQYVVNTLYWPHTALSVYRVCYFLVPHTHVLCMGSGSATGFFYQVRLVHSLLKYFFKFQLWYWIQIYTTKYSNLLLIILILVWIVCSTYRKGEILMQKWHVTSQFVYCYMPY